MKCVVGIDLGSTTTKAVLLDEQGNVLGLGITNSRSNYEVASAVARQEAHTAARFRMLRDAMRDTAKRMPGDADACTTRFEAELPEAFRLEVFLMQLVDLEKALRASSVHGVPEDARAAYAEALAVIVAAIAREAPALFSTGRPRKSDFFRDLVAEAFVAKAEGAATERKISFERLMGAFDRAILDVEQRLQKWDFQALIENAASRVLSGWSERERRAVGDAVMEVVHRAGRAELEEVAYAGTGYGRQTLPFPKEAVKSEILCHGRGAHRAFPGTRTVLDIGGQDTKAIQVDSRGVVSSFQMNDRCAAGCGRYLGYIADELSLGLHELGPLALCAKKVVRVNSTCTVFAGAELRERLALGERREDILAGLHRSIMLRAMALLARSGGVANELTFTGGVSKNAMATKVLRELVDEHYGREVHLNVNSDSIYMGALGAALFALDEYRAGSAIVPEALRDLYEKSSRAGTTSTQEVAR